jgi:hypothetical protein
MVKFTAKTGINVAIDGDNDGDDCDEGEHVRQAARANCLCMIL